MHAFCIFKPQLQQPVNTSKMTQIEAALAHLRAQSKPNYAEASRLYRVPPSTLSRRFRGITASRAQSISNHCQALNNVQEDTLLGYIDTLTNIFMPPTTQIVRNLAEQIAQRELGINWTARFLKRHSNRITSPYLRALDSKRASAESVPTFEHFYQLVLF